MLQTRLIMGMPITIEVVDANITEAEIAEIFAYFESVDARFSTYKENSEISRFNRGEIALTEISSELQSVFALAAKTKQETNGYFDIEHNGVIDPSGLVKGWAIYNAAQRLRQKNFRNFYVDAGGDIELSGKNTEGQAWRIGIRNPFNLQEIVKILCISDGAIATSGNYIRGQHVYKPKNDTTPIEEIVSLTVVASNIYDADRFATAAFAMGVAGIEFIESLAGFEAYMIDVHGIATYTSGFEDYLCNA